MTLVEFAAILRKRWIYILVPFLVAAGAAFALSKATPPTYTAEASVYFALPYGQSGSDLYQGSSYTQQQIGSFAQLAREPIVLDAVSANLGLDTTSQQLARSVEVTTSAETVIIEIAATDPDPAQAAAIANAVTVELTKVVKEVSPALPNKAPAIRAVTTARAVTPTGPSAPNTKRNVLVGGLLGLFAGLLTALARDKFDTRVRSDQHLPAETALLSSTEFDRDFRAGALTAPQTRRERVRHESYRKLRTGLRFLDIENPAKVIVVTSSVGGEGKSTTSLSLACVLAEDGQRVLLIDADLRRPKMAEYTGLEGAIGLVHVLAGTVDVTVASQSWLDDSIHVLPSGIIPPNPSELLGSRAMADLIGELRDRYDYIVIDAPPLLPVADAAVVSTHADGALVVVRYGKTTRQQLRTAVDSLRAVNSRVLGVILNQTPAPKPWRSRSSYHDDNYYYHRSDDENSELVRAVKAIPADSAEEEAGSR